MPKFTRDEIAATRAATCKLWPEKRVLDALGKRFPGSAPIDLADMIDAWLADDTIPLGELWMFANTARKLAGFTTIHPAPMFNPRGALRAIRDSLE